MKNNQDLLILRKINIDLVLGADKLHNLPVFIVLVLPDW